jgi:hypothetical protein
MASLSDKDAWTKADLANLAYWQKQLIWLVLLSLVSIPVRFYSPLASLIIVVVLAYFVYKFAKAVRNRVPILFSLLFLIPIIGILGLLYLNQKAIAVLNLNGISVGFMGVPQAKLKELKDSVASETETPSGGEVLERNEEN